MTDVVPTPAAPNVPQYPALGSANFNQDAYNYGSAMPGVSYRIWEIGAAAEANARTVAELVASAATSQRIATEQADAAMGYRNTTQAAAGTATAKATEAIAAAGQAVPAASQALDAARRAEEAAAGVADGPVTSVNGKTGIVNLAPADVGAAAEASLKARMQAAALSF